MKITLKHILLIFFFSLVGTVFSQNSKIDSLKIELQNHTLNDTTRVNLLNELANTYCSIDVDKALVFLKESEKISNTINYTKGKAKVIYNKGLIKEVHSNYDQAAKHYKKALDLFKIIDFKIGISDCLIGLGGIHNLQSNQDQAILCFNEVIKINEAIGNEKGLAKGYNNLGIVYISLGNYSEAIIYLKKVLKINEYENNRRGVANGMNNLGIIYYRQGNYSMALEYFQNGLSVNEEFGDALKVSVSLMNIGTVYSELQNYNQAIKYSERALKMARKNDQKKDISTIMSNLGIFYHKKKIYKTSISYLKKALKLSQKINFKMQVGLCLNNLGDVYLSLKNYSQSLTYFQEAKKINLKNGYQLSLTHSYLGIAKVYTYTKIFDKALKNILKSKELSDNINLLSYERDVEKILSEIYENKGNYRSALQSHQKYKKLSDSTFNKKNIEKITQLKYEYKYQKSLDSASIRELQLTKTVTVTNKNLEKSQQNLLLGVIAFLVTTLILTAIIFFLKLRNEKSKTQNVIIEQKLLRSQMTPHFIFNSLSVLQGMILNKEEKNAVSYLSKFSKLLRIILENSRHKTVILAKELSAINSYMALQNLDMNPPFEYTLNVDSNINETNFKIPPMLIQPFIENAIEHAFPDKKEHKKINVTLIFKEEKLICTIKDNGIGIDEIKQKLEKNKNSLATTITSERLATLSKEFKTEGTIKVQNRKILGEEGTLVTLVVPYKIELV